MLGIQPRAVTVELQPAERSLDPARGGVCHWFVFCTSKLALVLLCVVLNSRVRLFSHFSLFTLFQSLPHPFPDPARPRAAKENSCKFLLFSSPHGHSISPILPPSPSTCIHGRSLSLVVEESSVEISVSPLFSFVSVRFLSHSLCHSTRPRDRCPRYLAATLLFVYSPAAPLSIVVLPLRLWATRPP